MMVTLAVGVCGCQGGSMVNAASGARARQGTTEHPFAADSPWNAPIPRGARFTDNPWIHYKNPWWINWGEWSAPHYIGRKGDPLVTVSGRHYGTPMRARVHLPAGAKADAKSDGELVLYDTTTGKVWDFYQFKPDGGEYRTSNISVDDYRTGRGFGPLGGSQNDANGCRASGAHWAAGMIRGYDLQRGVIDHALAVAIGNAQLKRGPIPPATGEDDNSQTYRNEPDGLPMGTRLGIPPDVNVDSLFKTPQGRMLAHAMQKYGCYVVDRAGAVDRETAIFSLYADSLSVSAEQVAPLREWWNNPELQKVRSLLKVVTVR